MPWLLLLSAVLAVLVAIFGPVEARSGRHRTRRRTVGYPGPDGVAVAGYAAVVAALLINSAHRTGPEPLGTPVPALAAYLAGAGVLRLLRSGWGSRG